MGLGQWGNGYHMWGTLSRSSRRVVSTRWWLLRSRRNSLQRRVDRWELRCLVVGAVLMLAAVPLGVFVGLKVSPPHARVVTSTRAGTPSGSQASGSAARSGGAEQHPREGRPIRRMPTVTVLSQGDTQATSGTYLGGGDGLPMARARSRTHQTVSPLGQAVLTGMAVGTTWLLVVGTGVLVLRRQFDARRDMEWASAWEALSRSTSDR